MNDNYSGNKKRAMTVTYEVDGGLYVNVTNRCTNNCSFCIRNNGDGAYGSDSLWLTREPTESEILNSIFERDLTKYKEIVFCGYGEPTMRLDVVTSVAKKVKSECKNMTVRINTNGQSDLYFGRDTAPDFSVFDAVSISLNSPSPEGYDKICKSIYGENALPAILKFAGNVKKCVQKTVFSVVKETLSEDELEECRAISDKLGVSLRVRDLIT